MKGTIQNYTGYLVVNYKAQGQCTTAEIACDCKGILDYKVATTKFVNLDYIKYMLNSSCPHCNNKFFEPITVEATIVALIAHPKTNPSDYIEVIKNLLPWAATNARRRNGILIF